MLATFIIGLREGLEAALIVGIIAAFLRRNGKSLRPMWIGVSAAVVLSITVGVVLALIEQSLPQAKQEGMEAIIGVVAVVFVTGMILWMRKNSRGLKAELEHEAAEALGQGSTWALAGMAFLAVLKEGFETSVFLLATFQAASNTTTAAAGALVGILTATVLGYGIFAGGVRLNLGKFFTWTGAFLVLVAAGLVVSVLRTGHEAGWVNVGQARTVDLSWLAPANSIRGALITGVLGIPSDPRVIEVLGWFLYLVPVMAISLWPQNRTPRPDRVPAIRLAIAAVLAVSAIVLVAAVPGRPTNLATSAPTNGAATAVTLKRDGDTAQIDARLKADESAVVTTLAAKNHTTTHHEGIDVDHWKTTTTPSAEAKPATLTLDDLVSLYGRIPTGISPAQNPGPFDATWKLSSTTDVWAVRDGILDASSTAKAAITLSGGGLSGPRVISVDNGSWSVPAKEVGSRATAAADALATNRERRLWNRWLPLALLVAASIQTALALRDKRRLSPTASTTAPAADNTPRSPLDVIS